MQCNVMVFFVCLSFVSRAREAVNSTYREENDSRSGWEHLAVRRCSKRERFAILGDGRLHEHQTCARVEGVAREAEVHQRNCTT